jgi:hypothetical protein
MEAEIPDSESSAVAIFDLLGRGTTEEPIEAAPEATTDALPSAEAGPDATEKSVTTAQAASGTAQQPAEAQPAVSGTVPEPEPRDSAEEGGFEGFLAGLLVGLLGMVGIAVFMNRQKLMGRRGRSQGSRRKSADEAAGKAPPVQVRPAALNKEKDEKEEEAREKLAALLEAERAKEQQLGGGKPEAEDPGDTPEQPDKRQS